MPRKPRSLNVQTPGAAQAPEANEAATQAATQAEAQAPEAAAEPAEQTTRRPRAPINYRQMRAADIDPAKLTAPVLSMDGWVVPFGKAKHPAARD